MTGVTINDLTAMSASDLTANDVLPVWDSEAGSGVEPTKKITAQNLANRLADIVGLSPFLSGKTSNDFITPTLTNGEHYSAGTHYIKIGCFVFLAISAVFTSVPTSVALFTLPEGYRPVYYSEIAVSGAESYNAKAQCAIGTNGVVRVTSVDKYVTGSGIFVASL